VHKFVQVELVLLLQSLNHELLLAHVDNLETKLVYEVALVSCQLVFALNADCCDRFDALRS
jgi:hypothetical protein